MDEKLEELELARFLADVKYEDGNYVLQDWPIAQSLHDAKTLARALLAAGYAKRADVVEECAKVADDYDTGPWGLHSNMSVAAKASEDIATQIRNLKDKP